MDKQLLSFVSLVALTVASPSIHLVAAPTDGPGSAAESDRKFLSNLENNDAAKPVAREPAPAQPAAPPVQRRTDSAQNQTVIRGDWSETKPSEAPNPHPGRSFARAAARSKAAQSGAAAAPREIAEGPSQATDVQTDPTPEARIRTYKSRTADETAAVTARTSTRKVRDVESDDAGTHIVRPAEIAQYGTAPTVPTRTTKITTTTSVQPATTTTATRQTDDEHDADHARKGHFFDRLFHGGIFTKHGDE